MSTKKNTKNIEIYVNINILIFCHLNSVKYRKEWTNVQRVHQFYLDSYSFSVYYMSRSKVKLINSVEQNSINLFYLRKAPVTVLWY